jgi:hypothetical protein
VVPSEDLQQAPADALADTSRVIDGVLALRATLSTSSM